MADCGPVPLRSYSSSSLSQGGDKPQVGSPGVISLGNLKVSALHEAILPGHLGLAPDERQVSPGQTLTQKSSYLVAQDQS